MTDGVSEERRKRVLREGRLVYAERQEAYLAHPFVLLQVLHPILGHLTCHHIRVSLHYLHR